MWDFIYQYDLQLVFRLLVACVCGVLVGIERKNRAKDAGIRTHCLVACAAALMMILSKYAYDDMLALGEPIKLDPSRVASGVASGVGFLGAGMIFVYKRTITGLTTAAGIWATAGVGLAIGAGLYIVGIAATVIILLVQLILHSNAKWMRKIKLKKLTLHSSLEEDIYDQTVSDLKAMGIAINEVAIRKKVESGYVNYDFVVEVPDTVSDDSIVSKFNCDCSLTLNE